MREVSRTILWNKRWDEGPLTISIAKGMPKFNQPMFYLSTSQLDC